MKVAFWPCPAQLHFPTDDRSFPSIQLASNRKPNPARGVFESVVQTPGRASLVVLAIMATRGVSVLKFVGTVSVGLLTVRDDDSRVASNLPPAADAMTVAALDQQLLLVRKEECKRN